MVGALLAVIGAGAVLFGAEYPFVFPRVFHRDAETGRYVAVKADEGTGAVFDCWVVDILLDEIVGIRDLYGLPDVRGR